MPTSPLADRIARRVQEQLGSVAPRPAPGCGCALEPPHEDNLRAMMDGGACRLSCGEKARGLPPDLAATIDHTLLKPDADEAHIRTLCQEALRYHFASVCVHPHWVPLCASLLAGSGVETCTVIGFPHGANQPETKAFETRLAVSQGATEVDMVLNVGALKSRHLELVFEDMRKVVEAAGSHACVKVILETTLLDDEEKVIACTLAKEAGAHYVKTSTGFAGGGATVADVELMRRVVGSDLGVKASGGVRDRQGAEAMIAAGANRIGASAGIKIVQGGVGSEAY
jgi:deoxyribose-phosphate aldolase